MAPPISIRLIDLEATLPLRSAVLRNGGPFEVCIFPEDGKIEAFHLGAFFGEKVVGIASFYVNDPPEVGSGKGFSWQLRGMAVDPEFRRKGLGRRLLEAALQELQNKNGTYLWCNARQVAYAFYEDFGMEYLSEAFDIPGIGAHRRMGMKV